MSNEAIVAWAINIVPKHHLDFAQASRFCRSISSR
jgi:hypothetical protein